jgi:putative tricarboxylic transport membrane protein
MKKSHIPTAPLILGVLLGPMTEENLRRALLMSDSDWSIFITRPISLGLLGVGLLTLIWPWVQDWYQNRIAKRLGIEVPKE